METWGLDVLRPERLTWASADRLFTLRCKSNNVAATTQRLYGSQIGAFKRWAESQGLRPSETTTAHLRAYLEAKRAKGNKDVSVDCSYRVLKTFWRFLKRDGLIIQDPMEKVEHPRIESRLIRPFTTEQLRALLSVIPARTDLGARDFALLTLLADSGLRVSEALSLEVGAVDFGSGTVRVMGKGRKERVVPFGQTAKRALIEWLKVRGEIPGVSSLWINRLGHGITSRQVLRRMVEYGEAAKIEQVRISPHTLRHTFAVSYLRNGGDPLTLQRILGHTDLAMTRRYVALTCDDLAARHRLASPLDKMGLFPNERKQVRLK